MNFDILQKFRDVIEYQSVEPAAIEAAIEPVCAHINAYFYDTQTHERVAQVYGSYRRGTAILGQSSIDILYYLPDHFRNFISANVTDSRQWMGELLDQILSGTAWTAKYDDVSRAYLIAEAKPWPIKIKPVFFFSDTECLTLEALMLGSGKLFQPFIADKIFSEINFNSNGNLDLLAKTVRYWVLSHHIPMTGFLVDCLAMSFILQSPYRRLSRAYQDCLLRDFFKFLSRMEPHQNSWTIEGSREQVWRIGPFESDAERAYLHVESMIANSILRQDTIAYDALRQIVGNVAFQIP